MVSTGHRECLGMFPGNYALTPDEGNMLADYLVQGGNLYMEGGDTWYFDTQTAVHGMFNINAINDGADDLNHILGISGTFTSGMNFNYSGENSWVDHIVPIAPAFSIFENDSPLYETGIAYNEGTYNTIGTSFEFGGLDDGILPSTSENLMSQYLDFFKEGTTFANKIDLTFEGYNIYRNNQKLNGTPVTDTFYIDNELSSGTYIYHATTVYEEGESEASVRDTVILSLPQLDLKVFLDGPFNGTDMNTGLLNELPLSQPYNATPWHYYGTEAVVSIPNPDIVDWILVELRDTTEASLATSQTVVARQACFLLKDGSIVATNGSNLPLFTYSPVNSIFVVIWHRNSIGIMSALPLVEIGGKYSYDFTVGSEKVYGGANAHKEIGPGMWGMTGADGNADGQINNGDKNDVWSIEAGSGGYLSGDFNLDTQVNNGDKNDIWIPNTGSGGQVPDFSGQVYKCYIPE